MQIKSIAPAEAQQLVQEGARLVDIREADEYAREHLADAQLLPLSAINKGQRVAGVTPGSKIIFHCQSGARSAGNAQQLVQAAAEAEAEVYLLAGGLNAWRQAGLATVVDKRQPLMRQVQIAAGLLVLCGVVLGYTVASGFFLLAGLVGAGLLFAGVSGYCGMARLLEKMPWNRGK